MAETLKFAFDHAYARDMGLQADGLACRRGGRLIFKDISFTLHAGQALRLAGVNGSGKSSLLRQLAGLLPVADGMFIHVLSPLRDMHYLGHDDGLKAALSVAETLVYECALARKEVPQALLTDLGLAASDWQYVGDLSAGQKRRLTLARLLLDPRPLWLLDEPLTALDASGRKLVEDLAEAHLARGGMIIAASHEALAFATQELRLGADA
ncbi:MAG: Cytochrome c biogenesis ATP-binding export protein CcmA [Alphaproteobacteria bacterium]|nr:MAG: Cytochrome c biogenesis ATP-binding export protein CcmA [Alphaproteobacteria bacterium]